MKLIDAKFGMAVHVGGKETLYANSKDYECEIVYKEEIKMAVVEVTLKNGKPGQNKAWTSFANVVYCRPLIEEKESTLEPASSAKGNGSRKASAPSPQA